MKNKTILLLVSTLFSFANNAQVIYYQDVFKGGVTGAGFSTGGSDGGFGDFNLIIDNSSTIRKAFLLCVQYSECNDVIIGFDGNNLLFNETTRISNSFFTKPEGTYTWDSYIHSIDVTSYVNVNQQSYNIIVPPQQPFLNIAKYSSFYLIVLYENPNFVSTGISIYTNDKSMTGISTLSVDYLFQDFLPIDISKPVGFSLNSDIVVDTLIDDTEIFINSNYNGHIGGSENNYLGTGVKGDFNYSNNVLLGIGNDNADSQFFAVDGLAEISSFLNLNELYFSVKFVENPTSLFNNYLTFHLSYSTPCDAFSVSVPSDTTICRGESLQLNVVGGSQYEWQPATDLSCSTCPNPVFTGDSTQLYTVRIWNNDSCSVVRPVKISVRNQPNFGTINLTPSICGTNSGSIVASSLNGTISPITYQLNGGIAQSSGSFLNVGAGFQTVTIQDGFGCKRDSVVTIGQVNNTMAQFSANPTSGAVPFSVSLSNTSVFADQFLWSLNGTNQGSTFSNFTATQTGNYLVELVAWQFDPACADTATLSITAFDSLMVQVPNILTANNDHINDFFTFNTNLPLKGTFSILNRWGEVVYTYNGKLQQGETVLWDGKLDGKNVTEGTYFYRIELSEDPESPLAIDKSQLPFKLEGFVDVRR